MKWISREKARVDRIACPWLITRFIDKEPTFLFVPASEVLAVAKEENAIPYDVSDVELGHHGDHCSFDAFVKKYELKDPALVELARIVRGADTDAVASGFRNIARDDFDNMARQFPVYDALYEYCRARRAGTEA